jgi:hypothetical protein
VIPYDPDITLERTCFQTQAPWDPMVDLRSDVAICYGIGKDIATRIADWASHGYVVHCMTGVAWGEYQDYLYGRFDGINHVDEAQTQKNGEVIGHGGDVYYMSPGINYGKFLCVGVKRALDAGAQAIHLEEPEFWVRAGWSQGFRREWKDYYHEDWQPPDTSPDAQYKASLLKYYLYRRALTQVFDFVKQYNADHGTHVKCYVPTHSLINYAHWNIVSPESSLLKVGADGFIAQTWTGTARTPNIYQGKEKSRTFETAFFEYGAMMNVVRASHGKVWFLNDPIEDDPDHSWRDYRTNWESTLTASLLWPQVSSYEVMPWPNRIFHGTYPVKDSSERKAGEEVKREPIPAEYATELMTVINALNHMNQPEVSWDCGTQGIGVVVSDSMMFQRGAPIPADDGLGSFFGLAMPLLKHGIPAEPVQLENATMPGTLDPYRVLLMTYEGMKPMTPEDNAAIAAWVKNGGALVFVDDGSDPYNSIRSWWNTTGSFATARAALFNELGVGASPTPGAQRVGKGWLIFSSASPAALTRQKDGADQLRKLVKEACHKVRLRYHETNYIALRRGPYMIAAGFDESLLKHSKRLNGHFLDLFDPHLAVLRSVTLKPGSRYFLLDLDKAVPPVDDLSDSADRSPTLLAAACKTFDAHVTSTGDLQFVAVAPEKTSAVVRVALPGPPAQVTVDGTPLSGDAATWDAASQTVLVRFDNSPGGHTVVVSPGRTVGP